MTNGQKYTPMLKAGGLWAKTSAKGGRYLSGRLGGVKVLILANRDRQNDNDPSHHLFFVEAPDRRQGGQERGGGQQAPAEPRTNPKPSQPQQSGSQTHAIAEDDDVPPWER
jgi:hypothetical protein